MSLRHDRFQADAADLIKAIQRLEQERAAPPSTKPQGREPDTSPVGLERVADFRRAEVQRPSPGAQVPGGSPPVPVNEEVLTYREFTGRSIAEALQAATEHFGVGLARLDFEIVAAGSRGVLGVGQEPARVVAKVRAR
jgi:Jag N-terminus